MGMWRGVYLPLLFVAISGCGTDEGPQFAEVTGQILLNGKPLERGTVYFMPDKSKGTTGPMSIGELGPDGKFTLSRAGEQLGAIVGFHRVRIEARAKPKDYRDTEPPFLTPEHYNDPAKSGLNAEIKAGQANVANFKLTSSK